MSNNLYRLTLSGAGISFVLAVAARATHISLGIASATFIHLTDTLLLFTIVLLLIRHINK